MRHTVLLLVAVLVACAPRTNDEPSDAGIDAGMDAGRDAGAPTGVLARLGDLVGTYRMPERLSVTLSCPGGSTVVYRPSQTIVMDPAADWEDLYPEIDPANGGIVLINLYQNAATVQPDGTMTIVNALQAVAPEVRDFGSGEPNGESGFVTYTATFTIDPMRLSGTMQVRDAADCTGSTSFQYDQLSNP